MSLVDTRNTNPKNLIKGATGLDNTDLESEFSDIQSELDQL